MKTLEITQLKQQPETVFQLHKRYTDTMSINSQSTLGQFSKIAALAEIKSVWSISPKVKYLILSSHTDIMSGTKFKNRVLNGCIKCIKTNVTYQVIYYKALPEQCFNALDVTVHYKETVLGNYCLVTVNSDWKSM